MRRNHFLTGLVVGLYLATTPVWSQNQSYPDKPITLEVGFPPGGSTDVAARVFGAKIAEVLGTPVVIYNRAGATGSLAAIATAKSKPDGYKLLFQNSATFANQLLSKNSQVDPIGDFTSVAYMSESQQVLIVRNSLPVDNVRELAELAGKKPESVTFGSEGVGGTAHLAAELFAQMKGLKLTHIPYKSASGSTTAVAAGEIDMAFSTLTTALPLLKAGKYRPLAVAGKQRSSLLPGVPTLDESGWKDFDQTVWFGMEAPAQLPRHIVQKLYDAIAKVSQSPDVQRALNAQGMEVRVMPPNEFLDFKRKSAHNVKTLASRISLEMQ